MTQYRKLTEKEIGRLKAQMCTAAEWNDVEVADGFSPEYVHATRFSGKVKLGRFDKVYIANYEIGHDCFIENVDIILVDGRSSFGNGVEVSVLNETGGREVVIHDYLSAHQAYFMALYRHRPDLIAGLKNIVARYVESVTSDTGTIAPHVTIVDAGYIKNVKIGEYCKIEGTGRLKNGSINSNIHAPVHIGVGVIGDDFIICSGASVEDRATISRCFIGQSCHIGHTYSASDSLFF